MTEVWNPELKFESFSFCELAAQKMIGKPEFKTYSVEVISGGTMVILGPVTTFKKGPRKGQLKYGPRKDCARVLVSQEKVTAARDAFVAETGRCPECFGNGLSWSGRYRDKGVVYRSCRACNATGKANGAQEAV